MDIFYAVFLDKEKTKNDYHLFIMGIADYHLYWFEMLAEDKNHANWIMKKNFGKIEFHVFSNQEFGITTRIDYPKGPYYCKVKDFPIPRMNEKAKRFYVLCNSVHELSRDKLRYLSNVPAGWEDKILFAGSRSACQRYIEISDNFELKLTDGNRFYFLQINLK